MKLWWTRSTTNASASVANPVRGTVLTPIRLATGPLSPGERNQDQTERRFSSEYMQLHLRDNSVPWAIFHNNPGPLRFIDARDLPSRLL